MPVDSPLKWHLLHKHADKFSTSTEQFTWSNPGAKSLQFLVLCQGWDRLLSCKVEDHRDHVSPPPCLLGSLTVFFFLSSALGLFFS